VFTVLVDLDNRAIPSPFEQYQATPLEADAFWRLVRAINGQVAKSCGRRKDLRQLRELFDTWWPEYERTIWECVKPTLSASGDWSLVGDGLVAAQIGNSPFQAKDVFRVAENQIDLVAQNHYYIAVDKREEHTDLLRRFLSRKGRVVNILAMDSRAKAPVKAWTDLMGKHFPKDLQNALTTLRQWQRLAITERWRGKLEIRLTGLIPTSQTFFDPLHGEGGLVMVPMINKPSTFDRPAVVITKRDNPVAFEAYWTAHFERFRRARRLR
jgi:hypothetical protein